MTKTYSDDNCHFDVLSHTGNIQRMDNDNYYVSIVAQSACSSCHSRGVCSVTEMKEKVIEIPRQPGEIYQKGDSVEVLMKKSLGTKAVIIGYLIPFILLIITLVAAFKISGNEGIAGLSSISVLAFYYGVLYLIRDRLRKTFTFTIIRS